MKSEVVVYENVKYRRYPNGGKSHQRYFWSSTTYNYLHRQIWEDEFGRIPPKHEIHHKDGDTLNNDPSNLKCLPKLDHIQEHVANGSYAKREYTRRMWSVKTCAQCGVSFRATGARSRYCTVSCKNRFFYLGRKNG